jgi:UDP-hydrolysing UDP-N-acetyl-D-glucosamine 2-epimerase
MAGRGMKRRKICIVTTSRADYGLLYWVMKAVQEDSDLKLSVVVTGMHLSNEFGMTVYAIEADGFQIAKRVEMLISSDSESAVVKSMGISLISFADTLQEIKPDIVVLLGDRFEIVPVAIASSVLSIPLAHIHGGETSQGAIDEVFRHAVTKLASVHFPATDIYRKRILQMGESPERTFNFGAPGLDALYNLKLLNRKHLEKELEFALKPPTAIITYHPVTLEPGTAPVHIDNLLNAIEASGIRAIFTKTNADAGGRIINSRITEFCRAFSDRFKLIDNLGQVRYLSCLKNMDLMIGNSSSGLIEAPSFNLPVVNIGDRQKGRIKAKNVIDTSNGVEDIREGIEKALSLAFRKTLNGMKNPYDEYGDGKNSIRIKDKLKTIELPGSLKKEFCDLNCEELFGT